MPKLFMDLNYILDNFVDVDEEMIDEAYDREYESFRQSELEYQLEVKNESNISNWYA